MKTPILQAIGLHFSFEDNHVLRGISVDFPSGELVSIIGQNGCGKTTFLKILCAVLKPSLGDIKHMGKNINQLSARELAKQIAVVHQVGSYYFDFTVEDYVLMGRYPHLGKLKKEGEKDLKICDESMEKTGINHLRKKFISQISGGERQRVTIARALAQQPNILLLDEPVSQLDLRYQIEILSICKELIREGEITVITTLHDINLASEYSDKILAIKDGLIYGFGSPSEIIIPKMVEDIYGVKCIIADYGYRHIVSRGVIG